MSREIFEIRERIKIEWENFSKEVEKCKDCQDIKRQGNYQLGNIYYCSYHEEVYREMEGCVI